jgi:FG-GAP-like repeat
MRQTGNEGWRRPSLMAAVLAASGLASAGPWPVPAAGQRDVRTYLKREGVTWFEVRRGLASLERRPATAPPPSRDALLSATSGLFEPYVAYATGSWPEAVAIGDVTGDRLNDVVLVTSYYFDPANDYKLFVYRQLSDGTLAPPVKYDAGGTAPESVAIGDIDGDGRNDVVVGNSFAAIAVFHQNPSGTLDPASLHATPDSKCVRIADLNHDGRADVVSAGWATDSVTVFLQQTGGSLAPPVVYSAPHSGYDDLEVGDINHDGLTDVAVMSGQLYATPNVSVLYQQPAGTLGGLTSRFVGVNMLSSGLGIGDVDGDRRNDLVVSFGGNRPTSGLAVFSQLVDGTLPTTPATLASYDIPEAVEVGDVSGDRQGDVVVAHGGWFALGVYVQAGGALGAEALEPIPYASHYNPHGLALGDINNDGLADVVIADYNNGLVVLRHLPAPPPPADYYTVTPCRLLDTRLSGSPLASNSDRDFSVVGACDIPTDVRAVALNVAAVNPSSSGHLTLSAGGPVPKASTLNFNAGNTRANNTVAAVGTAGEVWVHCATAGSAAPVHLVVDVFGYFR